MQREGVQGQCSHGRGHRVHEAWSLGCVKKDSEAPSGPQTDQKVRTLSAVGSHTVMATVPRECKAHELHATLSPSSAAGSYLTSLPAHSSSPRTRTALPPSGPCQ